jgi:invasion protein IalB
MKRASSLSCGLAGLCLLALALPGGTALAQSAAAKAGAAQPPAPVPTEPNTTIASYGDWVLRCQRIDRAGKAARVCEVAETIQVEGQANPIAQLAIGRMAPGDPLRATAVLPTAVSFPSNVRISEAKNGAPLSLEWRRCLPGGCFADSPVKDDLLARWRAQTDAGQLTFKDAAGRDQSLPLSFRGLAQALDALAKESAASR